MAMPCDLDNSMDKCISDATAGIEWWDHNLRDKVLMGLAMTAIMDQITIVADPRPELDTVTREVSAA